MKLDDADLSPHELRTLICNLGVKATHVIGTADRGELIEIARRMLQFAEALPMTETKQ